MKVIARVVVLAVVAAIAAGGGYYAGRNAPRPAAGGGTPGAGPAAAAPVKVVYTCSMHPQVRLDGPGDCPICEMPLIPAEPGGDTGGIPSLKLGERALAMASVETSVVEARPLTRELRAVGRIEYNESSLATITPRVDGYAERLFVNFTGVEIREGDHLAEVYSPELLAAQQELLVAVQGGASDSLAEMTRTRLRLLGMRDEQIRELEERGRTTDRVTLYSPISGTVIEKSLVEKAAFRAGDALYRIANLDTVWVYLEIYEYDLPWVRYGQKVTLTAEAIPGRVFEGLVTFIQPVVNEQTRTIRVPVHIENKDHALKPGMFVTAKIAAELTQEGRAAPTGIEGRYSCPMHPQVLEPGPGACPVCHMPLEVIPGGPAAHDHAAEPAVVDAPPAPRFFCPMKCEGEKTYPETGRCPVCKMRLKEVAVQAAQGAGGPGVLAVPVSAVLDSGTRRLVYVELERGRFEPRELTLGPRAGEYYPVLAGLTGGERVVTRGNFLIDSQFQVTGRSSLFYPGGLHGGPAHDHGAAGDAGAAPAGDAKTGSTDGHGH